MRISGVDTMAKGKLNLTVNDEIKALADELKDKTGYSISYIIELLLADTSEEEILKLHRQSVKEKK